MTEMERSGIEVISFLRSNPKGKRSNPDEKRSNPKGKLGNAKHLRDLFLHLCIQRLILNHYMLKSFLSDYFISKSFIFNIIFI